MTQKVTNATLATLLILFSLSISIALGQSDQTKLLIEELRRKGSCFGIRLSILVMGTCSFSVFRINILSLKWKCSVWDQHSFLQKCLQNQDSAHSKVMLLKLQVYWDIFLKKNSLLEKYISAEANAYPPSMKDPDGTWTSFFFNTHILVYNTKLIKKEDLPHSYGDLINPKWMGKIAMRSDDFDNFGMMLRVMGREKGLSWMQRLAAQGVELRPGSSLAMQLVAAGEFHLV